MLLEEAAVAVRPAGAAGLAVQPVPVDPVPDVTKVTILCAGSVKVKEPFVTGTALCCIKPPAEVVSNGVTEPTLRFWIVTGKDVAVPLELMATMALLAVP